LCGWVCAHQAAEPAQQYFGHTTMETAESFEMAGQLPTPLYTLFAQVNAHKQAFGANPTIWMIPFSLEGLVSYNATINYRYWNWSERERRHGGSTSTQCATGASGVCSGCVGQYIQGEADASSKRFATFSPLTQQQS